MEQELHVKGNMNPTHDGCGVELPDDWDHEDQAEVNRRLAERYPNREFADSAARFRLLAFPVLVEYLKERQHETKT